MIDIESIDSTIIETQRFVRALKAAKASLQAREPNGMYRGTKETAALRRASMDLSRALSELRKPGRH